MTTLTLPALALIALALWRPSWWPLCLAVAGIAPAGVALISGGVGVPVFYFVALFAAVAVALRLATLTTSPPVRLTGVPGLKLLGRGRERSGVLSFIMEDVHAHDVGTILDREGVAIRAGHHCAQPLLSCFGVAATVRASLAMYNTREDIDALVRGLHKVREVFA